MAADAPSPSPRDIIIVQPFGHLAGHYSVYTRQLCEALAADGHALHIISSHGFRGDWTTGLAVVHEAAAETARARRIARFMKGNWLSTRWDAWCAERRGFAVWREDPRRVLHVLDFEPLTLWVLNRLYGRPRQVLTLAGADYSFQHYYRGNLLRGLFGALSRHMVADLMSRMLPVVHAERLETVARERGLLPPGPVAMIPWGMKPKPELVSRDAARAKLGLADKGGPVALMFGQVRSVKGLDDLIDAVATLERGRIRVLVVGELTPGLGFDPMARVAEKGCAADFSFHLRYVGDDELETFFRAADFAVLPYKRYFHGESGVLAHTSEFGLPVVASGSGELGKRVREHGLGLTFEPENVPAIADALRQFTGLDPAERDAVRQRVVAYAASHSWAHVARRHVEVYREAAG